MDTDSALVLLLWSAGCVILLLVAAVALFALREHTKTKTGHVAVLVMGDFGRSPRMQYHAASLARLSAVRVVHVLALAGSPPCEAVREAAAEGRIDLSLVVTIGPPPSFLSYLWLTRVAWRVGMQLLQLPAALLFWLPKCDAVLMQTPPAVPLLPLAAVACRVRGMKLVVDWHNLGYTLMELDHRPAMAVSVYRAVEQYFGRAADLHFCVTQSMRVLLQGDTWRTIPTEASRSIVVYDHAPSFFRRATLDEMHKLFTSDDGQAVLPPSMRDQSANPFTMVNSNGQAFRRADRPALLVSGTSWTVDEPFNVLLEALQALDADLEAGRVLRGPSKVVALITGKGGEQARYQPEIDRLNRELRRVSIGTGYLKAFSNYSTLLGSADIGVSLHKSSSGFDLPMKVVDMLGCELPAVCYGFPAISELISVASPAGAGNGEIFGGGGASESEAASELRDRLVAMLADWDDPEWKLGAATPKLRAKRDCLLGNLKRGSWDDEWGAKARPALERLLGWSS